MSDSAMHASPHTPKDEVNQTWGGRFNSAPAKMVAGYTDSQHYDRALYAQDIKASSAHAKMLARQGIISESDAEQIVSGLNQILQEIESSSFEWKSELEDVHMNIEARLIDIIGEAGKKLHTGRSRNDQVALDFRLYIADSCQKWEGCCAALCRQLVRIASDNIDTLMPGYTHMQPAQPVSLAQHMLAYANMFRRDVERLEDARKRVCISPLGAAALAGSTYDLDPAMVAEEVGFQGIFANSMDAVSDRDFVLEALFAGSVIMMHLSRLCEEIIIWANPAFHFVRLPDDYSTGSSIMPQKKNPDVTELMRGKTGRAYGNLISMLTIMKGLPLTYNRDLQEDKEGFFDTSSTVISSLEIMTGLLENLTFNIRQMKTACQSGYLNATELADYLVSKGIPFREAHHITGKAVALAERKNKTLEDLDISELHELEPAIGADVYQVLDYRACVRRRETPGGTGPRSITVQLEDFSRWLKTRQTM